MKGISPRGIALLLSFLITLCVLLILIGSILILGGSVNLWLVLILAITTFVISYFVAFYMIKNFIYERIRVIYKTIHTTKGAKRAFDLDMSEDVINQVNDEVIEWAQERGDEIKELKEQEKFRREFIGNLAHELKTPVFSIQGYILTLLEGGLEDKSINTKFLTRAAKGVERMTHIIEDLDEITKYESGRIDLQIKRINITELVEDVMSSLEMKAKDLGVELRFKESPDKAVWVMADAGRIGQVLTNLIVNSINYNKEGGYTEVRFFDMDKSILIEVADNGIGISEKHLPRLFERFYRVDKSRSRHEGGTGLGLAIVKHIVESHEQNINVRSTEGVGSTFSFTLAKA